MLNTHAAGDAASLLSKDVTVRAASMRAAYSTGCSRRSDGSRGGSTMVITPMQRPARIASYAPVQPVADRRLTTRFSLSPNPIPTGRLNTRVPYSRNRFSPSMISALVRSVTWRPFSAPARSMSMMVSGSAASSARRSRIGATIP